VPISWLYLIAAYVLSDLLNICIIYLQGYLREGKCHIALGDPSAAVRSYQTVLELDPENQTVKKDVSNIDV